MQVVCKSLAHLNAMRMQGAQVDWCLTTRVEALSTDLRATR
jgi:hypothetical protein